MMNGLARWHHPLDEQQDRMDPLLRLRCMLRNLPAVCARESRTFAQLPPHTPVVLCAFGASLLKHLDALREAAHSMVIMATDRAAAALIQEGIEPRVVVGLSAWAEDFWQVPVRPVEACLVAPPEVDPVVAAGFEHTIWIQSAHSETRHLEERLGLELPRMGDPTQSAPIMLVRVARRLGCSSTALLGFDFCLDAYGRFFPDRERSIHDEVFEATGIEGRSVKVTHELNQQREAFEKELAASTAAADAPATWINAAQRGAHIEGTHTQELETFLQHASAHVSRFPVWQPHAGSGQESALLEELAKLRQVAASFMRPPRADGTDGMPFLVREIENMLSSGQVLLVEPARFFRSVADHLNTGEAALARQFAQALANEIEGEVERAMDRQFARRTVRGRAASAHVFPSLRELGCKLIELHNPELAGLLRTMGRSDWPPELHVEWNGQRALRLEYAQGGESLPLTERLQRAERVCLEVDQFIERTRFTPAMHGLVLLGPADWLHVDEIMRRFEHMDAIVVEPWVGLLREQLGRTDLLSACFRRLLVIGLDQRLPSWGIRYSQRLNLWRAQERTPVFFIPPALRKINTIRAHYESIRRAL